LRTLRGKKKCNREEDQKNPDGGRTEEGQSERGIAGKKEKRVERGTGKVAISVGLHQLLRVVDSILEKTTKRRGKRDSPNNRSNRKEKKKKKKKKKQKQKKKKKIPPSKIHNTQARQHHKKILCTDLPPLEIGLAPTFYKIKGRGKDLG